MTQKHDHQLINYEVNVKTKLAALWTTLMFLYIYADYFELKTPGTIENTMRLETPMGPATPGLLVIFSVLLIIPTLMIFLSFLLKPLLNKWLNIVLGFLYALISVLIISSQIGNQWYAFYVLYNVVEIFIFATIIWHAWTWPKTENLQKIKANQVLP